MMQGYVEATPKENKIVGNIGVANVAILNNAISVNGATVGQTVKIASVDENGVPTAWEAVDFPSVVEEEWEEIVHYTVPETVSSLVIDKDINGNPFELKRWLMVAFWVPEEGKTTNDRVFVSFLPGATYGSKYTLCEVCHTPKATEVGGSTILLASVLNGIQWLESIYKSPNTGNMAYSPAKVVGSGVDELYTDSDANILQQIRRGPATCINFYSYLTNTIHAGSVIRLYGIRARK